MITAKVKRTRQRRTVNHKWLALEEIAVLHYIIRLKENGREFQVSGNCFQIPIFFLMKIVVDTNSKNLFWKNDGKIAIGKRYRNSIEGQD